MMYHFDTQELLILPSLSMDRWSFLQPLLRFLPVDQEPSPWILKPVLSTMRWRGLLFGCWTLIFGLIVFPLRDKVVWSGTASLSFINWNMDATKPSVCLKGRWNMSRRERIVSMALSEKRCCLPLFFDVRGFQDLMTEGDIQRVKEPLLHSDCSYSFQLLTLYLYLNFGLRLRLCSSFISDSSFWTENLICSFIYAPKPLYLLLVIKIFFKNLIDRGLLCCWL